ncbi:peptidase M42 [Rhodopirellula sp.]|jgi:putative aminopeptidase FrvX|nr:peptidase M42 [Rhodopirellula sp.]MDA9777069.1 peptidase M42 [Rubripirellula sp.]
MSPVKGSCVNIETELNEYMHLLGLLIREPSVVGSEAPFYRVIRRELEELPIRVRQYKGLLVAEGEEPESVYLSAHVDRNGLLCTGPNEFQYAAFIAGNRGELFGDSVSEQMMELIQDRFRGERVQAYLPHVGSYLGQGVIETAQICPQRRNLIFEVAGLGHLEPGSAVSFLDRLKFDGQFLSGQLDNVVSVALLIHLLRRGFRGTALFTCEEEAGRSWRYVLERLQAESRKTKRLIVLDTSPYPSIAEATSQDLVLRRRDAGATFDRLLTQELENRCNQLGIRTSFKDDYVTQVNLTRERPMSYGRTELGRLITATGGEVTGTTLQIPTTGYHTTRETASLDSIISAIKVLRTYI